jgi:hypothetical protein
MQEFKKNKAILEERALAYKDIKKHKHCMHSTIVRANRNKYKTI